MQPQKLHIRQIKIESYYLGDNRMLVVGNLDDEPIVPYHNIQGGTFPPGKMHDMRVELEVSLPDLNVAAIRAEMSVAPLEDCRDVMPALQDLVGLNLHGFAKEVNRRLGGVLGCAHVRSLLAAMPPAAMQGAAALVGSAPVETRFAVAVSHALNSCMVWREGGPYSEAVEALRKELAEAK